MKVRYLVKSKGDPKRDKARESKEDPHADIVDRMEVVPVELEQVQPKGKGAVTLALAWEDSKQFRVGATYEVMFVEV